MTAPEPPAVADREARRARHDAEWARRDAEAEQRARLDARVDAAAAAAPSVLPGGVGETLAAVLAAMKPFRAADGHLSLSAVGRSSDEVVALAEAILALPADAVRPAPDTGQAAPCQGSCVGCGAGEDQPCRQGCACVQAGVHDLDGEVSDTGQAREPDDLTEALNWLRSNWATNSRDWAGDRREAAWYGVLVGWDCEEDHDHDDICGGTSGMDFVARRHVWAPAFVEALRRRRAAVAAAQSGDTVQAPDVAALLARLDELDEAYFRRGYTRRYGSRAKILTVEVRALLGADTTPEAGQ